MKFDRYSRSWRLSLLAGLAAVAVVGWLAWSIVANTAADNLVLSDPQMALTWRSGSAPALIALAGQKLISDAPLEEEAEIRALAHRAMVAAPLEDQAVGLLGFLAELGGNQAEADELMALAAQRSWRDGLVQIWSFYHEAYQGNFAEAVAHADALLRTRPNLQGEIAPTLVAFAVDPEAKNVVVDALANNPPWRSWYLRELAKLTEDPGIAYAVFSGLSTSANPPTGAELRAYLDNLVGAGQFEQAYLAWIAFLPEERRRSITYAYNGDFEYPASGLPFDWAMQRITGASTDIVETNEDAIGHAVRIEFANRRVPYRHLRKLLMLPPGTYELTGLAKAKQLENDRGLIWQVACAEGDKRLLGATEPVKGTVDWHRISTSYDVPDTECRAQWLTLVLPAKAVLEQEIGGLVWFDDFRITRAGEAGDGASSVN